MRPIPHRPSQQHVGIPDRSVSVLRLTPTRRTTTVKSHSTRSSAASPATAAAASTVREHRTPQPKASMRRHHFRSLTDTGHQPDDTSPLIDAEADQRPRQSTQIPPSPRKEMPSRPHSVLGYVVPGEHESPTGDGTSPTSNHSTNSNDSASLSSTGFLNRVQSYSRLMHAHTHSQLSRHTVGTLPSYKKTMHAFTLNQLSSHKTQSRSETSSLHVAARTAIPANELSKLELDEVPPAPGNTPEIAATGVRAGRKESHVDAADFRKLGRSLTDPEAVRMAVSFGIEVRDFPVG